MSWGRTGGVFEVTTVAGVAALVTGVVLSRLGLWGFDLSVQIQIQQGVEAANRARFSALESSVQSTFDLLSYVATIVWSHPTQFKYPATISVLAVAVASLTYTRFVLKERKHLFHFEKMCCGR